MSLTAAQRQKRARTRARFGLAHYRLDLTEIGVVELLLRRGLITDDEADDRLSIERGLKELLESEISVTS